MWVKIEQTKDFPLRMAIASISRHNMTDALGRKTSESFIHWFINVINEDIVRSTLSIFYHNVENWQLHCITFNYEKMCYDVVVSCNNFEEALPGSELKRLEPDKEFIKPQNKSN